MSYHLRKRGRRLEELRPACGASATRVGYQVPPNSGGTTRSQRRPLVSRSRVGRPFEPRPYRVELACARQAADMVQRPTPRRFLTSGKPVPSLMLPLASSQTVQSLGA